MLSILSEKHLSEVTVALIIHRSVTIQKLRWSFTNKNGHYGHEHMCNAKVNVKESFLINILQGLSLTSNFMVILIFAHKNNQAWMSYLQLKIKIIVSLFFKFIKIIILNYLSIILTGSLITQYNMFHHLDLLSQLNMSPCQFNSSKCSQIFIHIFPFYVS